MQKRLQATAEQKSPGVWSVTVTDMDAGTTETLEIKADTEKDAAFTAMEQVIDR